MQIQGSRNYNSYLREANQLLATSTAASSRLRKAPSRSLLQTESTVDTTPSTNSMIGQEQQVPIQPMILKSVPQPTRSRRAGSTSLPREEKKLWTPKGLFKASEIAGMLSY
jgi:hypothetical protein